MTDPAIAIPALLARYADAFDAGDLAGAAALFDGGCIVVAGKEIAGATRIEALWRSWVRIHADGTPRTRHLVSNAAITVAADGRQAECRSQWTVLQQAAAGAPVTAIGSGRYHDAFRLDAGEEQGGEWRFVRRAYGPVDFWGDTSGHLIASPTLEDTVHGTM